MQKRLQGMIAEILAGLGIPDANFSVERPAELSHGDWSTNVAMVAAKKCGKNPKVFAEEVVQLLVAQKDSDIESVAVAGPGFINITLSKEYFIHAIVAALSDEVYGNNATLDGKKVIVEYTDPNPFKEFHIGHLMSNTIGESLSRLIEASGAETKRACYQGDVGMQIACPVWVMLKARLPDASLSHSEKIAFLAQAYVLGATALKADEGAKAEITAINKKIYDRSDQEVNRCYDIGRSWSLDYLETVYKRLGTNHGDGKAFNFYFFESKTGVFGKEVVEKNTPEIFEESDGAIVYKGDEAKGLHTRVFINKEGLPTYEAKELGLAQIKYDTYNYDTSIVVTGNEVNDYFKVLLDAMARVFPELAQKTEHYGHGMLRLPTGKMSSRTGDVITAEALIEETKTKALEKIAGSVFSESERDQVAEAVAIGAIKYSILRQAGGKDIIFDFEQSLSFEGDSGPYLQYTHARTKSLLAKAEGKIADVRTIGDCDIRPLHKYLLRFPEVVVRAENERAPHHVATYLIEVAREFNAFYGNTIILDGAPDEGYKLALVTLTSRILSRGLSLLGIAAPERM
jgi:arginyl-tRNA synthetase